MQDYSLLLQGLIGFFVFILICWLMSENRNAINYKQTAIGIVVQAALAILIMKVPGVKDGFLWASGAINAVKDATTEGTKFVFGYLGGGALPFDLKEGASTFIFAFGPLPMVIVISALSMLLFYLGILPVIVRGFSWALRKTMGIGGALGVCAAAKVFLGQTDAPLLIRPYLSKFSRSELFTVMTAGMATTSATIMVLYGTLLEGIIPNPISHILTASIISIPAAIFVSRLIVPHTENNTEGEMVVPYKFTSAMDALAVGTIDGARLCMSLAAMVLVALSLVALTNTMLGVLPEIMGHKITLQWLFGRLMVPVTWLMGMPWAEANIAANILGTKAVLNEVVAFIDLSKQPTDALSPHSNLMMTYALCGFANLSSIGIQIGGLGTMAPDRREEIISLGFKALAAGTLSSCLSGTLVGILYWIG